MFRLAYTTLACPDWSWDEIVRRTPEYGYQGLELRGVEGEMDLPRAAPFTPGRLVGTKRQLADAGLPIVALDTSCRLHDPDSATNLDEARRAVELAGELGAPYIRVFGDRIPPDEDRRTVLGRIVDGLMRLGRDAEGTGVHVLIESHGDFGRTTDLREVLDAADHPQVGVLWDAHHPIRFYNEPVAETYARLRERIRHVHFKDSRQGPEGVRYALLGEGDVPNAEVIRALAEGGYDGYVAFEWEKRWHPEIEAPEEALPHFVRAFRRLEAEVGKR